MSYHEARRMGGGMIMLFDEHPSLEEALKSLEENRSRGLIRHFVIQVIDQERSGPAGDAAMEKDP